MGILHVKSNTIADFTGTVTVANSAGATVTANATDLVRPVDWNSGHNMAFTLTGNTTQNSTVSGQNIIVAGRGGVSVGGSNGSLEISGPIHFTDTMWYPYNEAMNVVGAVGAGTLIFAPLQANQHKEFNRVGMVFTFSNATNSTGTMTLSIFMGLYTKNASTMSLLHSASFSGTIQYAGNNSSASNRGMRLLTFPWTTTIEASQYYVGIMTRTATGGANASISQMLVSALNSGISGMMNAATNRSVQWPLGLGVMSVSTSALPASVAISNLDGTGTAVARVPSWFALSGTV